MKDEEDIPGISATDLHGALERFVIENDDLLDLESRIGRFNIFDALGIKNAEIRHSNFLAFILDPAESHGHGQVFLKAVLMDLLKQAPAELRPLSPIELDGTDLRGVEVRREWNHIDLLIMCQEPRFAIVIENKIGSKEGANQLRRYEEVMQKHYPNARPLFVYLTLNADESSENKWMPYSHADIYRVLKRVRETYRKAIGDDALVFLDHYLNLIGTRFMNDEEIDKLCQRIYKNHRQALDLIYERAGSPASGVLAEAANVLEEDARWREVWRPGHLVDFMPVSWLKWLPPIGTDYEDPREWIIFRFHLADGKLVFYVRVQATTDQAMRRKVAELIIASAPKFGLKNKQGGKVTDKRSKVSGNEQILEWSDGDEPEAAAIQVAIKKALDELYPKLEKMAIVLKPLCKVPSSTT